MPLIIVKMLLNVIKLNSEFFIIEVMVKNWRYAVDDLSENIKYIKDMSQNEFDKE